MALIEAGVQARQLGMEGITLLRPQLIGGAEQRHAPGIAQRIEREPRAYQPQQAAQQGLVVEAAITQRIDGGADRPRQQQIQPRDPDQERDGQQIAGPMAGEEVEQQVAQRGLGERPGGQLGGGGRRGRGAGVSGLAMGILRSVRCRASRHVGSRSAPARLRHSEGSAEAV